LRDVQVREREVIDSLKLQIKLAEESLKTYEGDASFLRTEPHDMLVCPTCGAEHHKTFMDVLNYAEDARVLQELVVKLHGDARNAERLHENTRSRLQELDSQYARVSQVLEKRRGDLTFDEVVRSMGAEVAFEAFFVELEALKLQIDAILSDIEILDRRLTELTSLERSKQITSLFRDAYAAARHALNLPAIDLKRVRLTSRPDVSGSGGPRAILAYYAAIWRASFGEHGSFSVPLVIDSPQQQGQDDVNLPKMIEYVAKNLPLGAQVLLGIETTTTEKFDHVIELSDPYQFLQGDKYDETNAEIAPLVRQMYANLLADTDPEVEVEAAPKSNGAAED
jgi:hypothetical protein